MTGGICISDKGGIVQINSTTQRAHTHTPTHTREENYSRSHSEPRSSNRTMMATAALLLTPILKIMSSRPVWSFSVSLKLTWVLVPSHCLSPLKLPYQIPASDLPLLLSNPSCSLSQSKRKVPSDLRKSSSSVDFFPGCLLPSHPRGSKTSFFLFLCLPVDFSLIHVLYPSFVGAACLSVALLNLRVQRSRAANS